MPPEHLSMRFMRSLKRAAFTGFLIVGPAGISAYLLYWVVVSVDGLMASPAHALLGRRIPGVGLLTAACVLLGVGFLASNLAGRHLLELAEDVLLRIPLFNSLYRTFKRMAEAFAPGGAQFRSVVLVEHPRAGAYVLGFVTNRVSVGQGEALQELTVVYVPTNHLYIGDILLVPKERVRETGLSLEQAAQAVFSAGSSLPREI